MSIGLSAIALTYFFFGVPRVKDKLTLTYKKDSIILNKIIEFSKLSDLTFKTCYAGTISYI